ncbi:LamG domain-containing protein [Pontiella sulfatireligans]|uniref:Laminin G domain-containing protein n=1 Tax=Pontiella sulfatireligans TaxID=2750658 RepID=A0A6C2UIC2_9BACT|nr:LamG domain-containing protein [Pontiella sulfatireligans]VGO19171.1 hypothetical protein SCARR_01228 [Pontiella sulfatireligans]
MNYNSRKTASIAIIFLALAGTGLAEQRQPTGLMLNLDFQNVQKGIIPSKTLFPLHVPLAGLATETVNNRSMLGIQHGQGLDIPHSSLLDPDGSEWIVSTRIFALTDGIVLSQGNEGTGYAIYLKDGEVYASVKAGHSAVTLQRNPNTAITDYRNKWVTVELRIRPDSATLLLNRTRIALSQLSTPLAGENMYIRIGQHRTLPVALKFKPNISLDGFTGGLNSLKIFRQ